MKIVGIVTIALFVIGVLVYVFYYNKPHRDIQREAVDYEMSADDLLNRFMNDEMDALNQFDNKVILVSGAVSEVIDRRDGVSIILLEGSGGMINCEVNMDYHVVSQMVEINETHHIKGLLIGYNDLLNEIQLKQCSIEDDE
jgi:hypothetical protein